MSDTNEEVTEAVETADTTNLEPPTEEVQQETDADKATRLEAELEKKNKQIGQAEHVIERLKKGQKTEKATEVSTETLSKEELKAELLAELKSERSLETEVDLLSGVSDPIEREAIRLELSGGIVRTGDAKADFEKAKAIVRAPHFQKVAKESAVTAASKAAVTNAGGGSNQEKPVVEANWRKKFNKTDLAYMEKRGFTEEQMKRAAENIK